MRLKLLPALTACAALALPASAAARDGYITSFDGTKIVYSFFPAYGLKPGQRVPTVMDGPGYSSGRASESDAVVSALLNHGYNVLTWDPRGFGDSGGDVEIDSPDYEARDASALIDLIARQPEAQLDKPGDPRLGMVGGSYGGGIQNVTAAIDPRVDVITPDIAWHSLITSLDKSNTAKGGWGLALFGVGVEGTLAPGVLGGLTGQPAGFQIGRQQDPRAQQALIDGASTGELTPADQAFFASRGPGELIKRVRVPTLITQGTVDTLFTLHEGIENYEAQQAAGANVSMIWFCGGHGVCLDSQGPDPNIVLDASIRWLDRYLKREKSVSTGPRFQWVSDKGTLYGARGYPLPQGPPLTAKGSGTLALLAGDTSGELIAAGEAANALNIPLAKPAPGTHLLGEPTLTITYSGTASSSDGRVYAQIVHDQSGRPLGNQVTPIPVTLDGATHTATFPLEAVAADAGAGDTYTLQLTDGSSVYFAARQAGAVDFSSIALSVPTVAAGAARAIAPPPPEGCPPPTGRLHGRMLGRIRLGMTRAQAHRAYRFSSRRNRRHWEFFCVSRGGIRVAYASAKLVRALAPATRRHLAGRVVWALTSNRHYSLRGVRVGARLRRAARRLGLSLSSGLRVGLNTWYIVPGRLSNGILKVRRGRVLEIGIVDRRLTAGRRRASVFLRDVGD